MTKRPIGFVFALLLSWLASGCGSSHAGVASVSSAAELRAELDRAGIRCEQYSELPLADPQRTVGDCTLSGGDVMQWTVYAGQVPQFVGTSHETRFAAPVVIKGLNFIVASPPRLASDIERVTGARRIGTTSGGGS